MIIKYPLDITFLDYPDPYNSAILIYCYGCSHNCKECYNPEMQKTPKLLNDNQKLITPKELYNNLKNNLYKLYKIKNLVFAGGDPLYLYNRQFMKEFLTLNKIFNICIYTGYSIKYIKSMNLPNKFKYIKSGKFDITQKQISEKTDDYIQFASKNQKLYDKNYELLSENGRYYFEKED